MRVQLLLFWASANGVKTRWEFTWGICCLKLFETFHTSLPNL